MYEHRPEKLHAVAGDERTLFHEALPRVHNNLARAERLAGDVRGTHRRAATALGARVAVEQVFPGEVFDVRRAELLDVGLEIHGTHRGAFTLPACVREEDVEQRRHDVQMLRVREIVEEGEHQQCMRPPAHAVRNPCAAGAQTAESQSQSVGNDPRLGQCAGTGDVQERAAHEERDHERAD